ncbi:hypothetical protein [Aneurinibacillus tyrosinisolvens]|uniref:hypothetical protein n=1 Tax=Aneurinibacillus tyrosinisolvens TaxID=1443435 RepID=UPI00069ADED8|nr:hypothetical protein [Aneurinibacillus tyrosinisolvens]
MKSKFVNLLFGAVPALCVLVVYLPFGDTYAKVSEYKLDINAESPTGTIDTFMRAENMAPGEEVKATLKILNDGNVDFTYRINVDKQSGSEDLYKKLRMTVSDPEGTIYEGQLSGLQQIPAGVIASHENETLTFTSELPPETGNEYQGLKTSVKFSLIAEQLLPGNNGFEPPFSNRNFTLQQGSTVPIKFHISDKDGNMDDKPTDNIRLVITGPGPNGTTVNYEFTQRNGKLDFNQKHYHAQFSTKDYPVLTNGKYKAIVYDGNKVICEKEFTVLEQGSRSNAP